MDEIPELCKEQSETIISPDLSNDVRNDLYSTLKSIPNERGFKMAFLNIVSLPKRIDEISLSMTDKYIDLFAMNETRLDSNIDNNMIQIDGYDVIRRDRSRNGGGVCIYIRNCINHNIRNDIVPPELEATCVEIMKPFSHPFIVATVYRPPCATSEFFDYLEHLLKAIDNENKEMYLLGDLNCDLLKSISDSSTKKLKSLYELYQLSQVIDQATRVTINTSSLIDHLVTNTPEKISASGVVPTGISDHSLVFAVRKIHRLSKKGTNIVEIRNMKNFNEKHFLNDLSNQCWEYVYFFPENPDEMWQIWKYLFLEVLNKHAPLQNKKIRSKRIPWVTSEIKKLMSTRDCLKRKAINTKLETDWSNNKSLRNKVNTRLRKAKKDYFSNQIASHKCNSKAVWKTINNLLGRQNKPTIVNELNMEDSKLNNPRDISEGFNEFFSSIGPNLASDIPDTPGCNFENYVESAKSEFAQFQLITVDKLFHLLCGVSSNKATGIDKISTKILKLASPVIANSLTYIFNQAVTLSTVLSP